MTRSWLSCRWYPEAALAGVLLAASWLLWAAPVSAQSCADEGEPNDAPEAALSLGGVACVAGTLGDGDQDLAMWEVSPDDARRRWDFRLDGIAGTLTALKFFDVTSEPGIEPVQVDRSPFLELEVPPDGPATATLDDLMFPVGRYLLGISRSAPVGTATITDESYTYDIEPGTDLPPSVESEPNDQPDAGSELTDAFSVGGDLEGSLDWYHWMVSEPDQRWALELQVPLGESAAIELRDGDGRVIDEVRGESGARSLDLALAPGTYAVGVSPRAYAPMPYILSATSGPVEGEPEPNDQSIDAVMLSDGVPLRGRLAGQADRDRFRLDVPAGEPTMRDVRVRWRSGLTRKLCLLDAADDEIACAEGTEGAALTNLGLAPGSHVIELSGPGDAADPYLLRVDPTTPIRADFEAEPNDTVAAATSFDPEIGMRARGGARDRDVFRLRTEGEPQLWSIELSSDSGGQVEWIRPDDSVLARSDASLAPAGGRLDDLYLVPGDHWFRVRGQEGEYRLAATPQGPPDPDAEHEPNNELVRAERYRVGDRRVGRLTSVEDVDFYRFSLAAAQHIVLRLDQPPDARTRLDLHGGTDRIGGIIGRPAGERLRYDLWLPAGDYVVVLRAEGPSDGRYELTSERLDPFRLSPDQEPNDDPAWAWPVPLSLAWQGDAFDPADEDWWRLPPLSQTGPLRISVDDERALVRLTAGEERVDLERVDDVSYEAASAPLDVPLYLGIAADGPYEAAIAGGGLIAQTVPPEPPVELSWDVEVDSVAAYWPEWQTLSPTLVAQNQGALDLQLSLESMTSHHLWRAEPRVATIELPAGAEARVPIDVSVAADAWADEPVLVSARIVATGGGQVSASVELQARTDSPPVESHPGWSVPSALLGGIDYALLGLGALPAGTVHKDLEPLLFDAVTPEGSGFGSTIRELPIDLSVDLAGDAPVAVAGIILNPQARDGALSAVPRAFELWLSADGAEWQLAHSGELSPLPVDQAFVLDAPVGASQARLRILSVYDSRPSYVALGEWKVVAVPGTPLPDGAPAVSHPALGGHVANLLPPSSDRTLGSSILDDDPRRVTVGLRDEREFELVVGFHEGRAAAVTELQWLDPDGSKPAERLDAVDVSVSSTGPLGPWQLLGRWDLERGADGAVVPYVMNEPAWARFVRLTGRMSADARALEMPATVRVVERATDDDYRSIIGEWGYTSPHGPLEWAAAGEGSAGGEVAAGDAADGSATRAVDAGDRAEAADRLEPGVAVDERVEIDVDEDWYRITVPADHDRLEIEVTGLPSVRVDVQLFDTAGARLPSAFETLPDGSVRFVADVVGGGEYLVRVYQPPFSAVFAFDTSGSMGPFREIVNEGMHAFAADVRPGREAVMIVPFEEPPLLPEWEDDSYLLQDAIARHVLTAGSSGAEAGLIEAMELLSGRAGARAILLVTDAETSTYQQTAELWERLEQVRPVVFSVHIGAPTHPHASRHLMQDWAVSGGGHYVYPTTHGEMDRAFDRMATWLRRPATYRLRYESLDLEPARLSVVAPSERGDDGRGTVLAPGVGLEVILDTSGSMRKRLGGKRRLDIAKASLRRLVDDELAEGVPVAIRTFGRPGKSKQARCDTTLPMPLGPLDRDVALKRIKGIKAEKKAGTPIAAALAAVPEDLAAVDGLKSVVLITDGAATCGGDVLQAIGALGEAGIDVKLDIVGFALQDDELKSIMAEWAAAGGGAYYDAGDAKQLAASVAAAVSAPFRVYGEDAAPLAAGTVGGEPVELEAGVYRVEVLTDPPRLFDGVELGNGAVVSLRLDEGER